MHWKHHLICTTGTSMEMTEEQSYKAWFPNWLRLSYNM